MRHFFSYRAIIPRGAYRWQASQGSLCAYRSALRPSQKVTFVCARAHGLFLPRVSETTSGCPLGWSLHTVEYPHTSLASLKYCYNAVLGVKRLKVQFPGWRNPVGRIITLAWLLARLRTWLDGLNGTCTVLMCSDLQSLVFIHSECIYIGSLCWYM